MQAKKDLELVFSCVSESGFNDYYDKAAKKEMLQKIKNRLKQGRIVGYVEDSVFKSENYYNMRAKLSSENSNIDYNCIKSLKEDDDVIYRMELEYYPQELYRILDTAIQTVISNENADCAELIAEASQKYETEYLQKINQK